MAEDFMITLDTEEKKSRKHSTKKLKQYLPNFISLHFNA